MNHRKKTEEILRLVKNTYDDELERIAEIRRAAERQIYKLRKRRDSRMEWLDSVLNRAKNLYGAKR